MEVPHELPRIFGDRGVFVEPSPEQIQALDAPTRQRLNGVRTAFANMKSAEAAEQAAKDDIIRMVQKIEDLEAYSKKNFKPQTQHDLWLDQKRERDRRLGMIK